MVGREGLGADLAGDGTRDERVRRARRDTEIVFQHEPLSVQRLYEIDACDVGEHVMRGAYAFTLGQIALGSIDEGFGHDAVFHDVLFTVNIGKEHIQRLHALGKPLFQIGPFRGRDNAGDRVEGEELFLEGPVLVDTETDAVAFHPFVHCVAAFN